MPGVHRSDEQRPRVLQIGDERHAHQADNELPPTTAPKHASRGLLGDIVHAPCLHYLFSAAGQRPEGSFLRGTRRAVWIPPYVLNPKSLAIREDLIFIFRLL
jgi:hypothetical protein